MPTRKAAHTKFAQKLTNDWHRIRDDFDCNSTQELKALHGRQKAYQSKDTSHHNHTNDATVREFVWVVHNDGGNNGEDCDGEIENILGCFNVFFPAQHHDLDYHFKGID